MTTKGSKSVLTKKAPAPARGGPPELKTENGTTLFLPNPADAPAPPKASGTKKKGAPEIAGADRTARLKKLIGAEPLPTPMRRSSTDPKTAGSREPTTPATEIPDWAKQAAGRNTEAEMAGVPEVAVTVAPPADAPVATKARTTRSGKVSSPAAKSPAKETPTAAPGSLRAIGNAWIDSIRAAGHSVSTVSSYGNDLEVAYEVLDGNSAAADLTEKQIARFNESKAVLKKANGKPKAKPTILKTRRALRLALLWAADQSLIKKAPFPAKTPA